MQKLANLEESKLVLEIKAGSEKSFELIFKTYYSALCRHAFGMLKDKEEAEEMVQNMFVNYWDKRENIDIKTSLKSYLYKSIHNLCLNNIKHQKIKKQYEQYNLAVVNTASKNENFSDELQLQINHAIESLPPQCKLIFNLSRFEELKYREIAETLDISEKTVENQMGKALKVMREKLSEYLPLLILLFLNLIRI